MDITAKVSSEAANRSGYGTLSGKEKKVLRNGIGNFAGSLCCALLSSETHLVRLLSSFSWPVVQLIAITAVRLLPQSATSKRLELPG